MLQGRLAERDLLNSAVDSVREGLSTALVIAGEPGIGKTRLLDYVADGSGDLRLARICGMQPEKQFAFAGLHRLLRPFLDRLEKLPDPQRIALATAFGLISGPPPDRFLVGLAALTLLADLAAELPVVCLVDDAQWLDGESLTALAFLGRRLDADGIGLVIGARDEPDTMAALRGLRTQTLSGLAGDDAYGLMAAMAAGRADRRVVSRIVAETGGNPLALIETGSALSPEQLAGAGMLPELLPIGPGLEAHFAGQVRQMPPATRRLLLLLAAAPPDDLALLWRAADRLGLDPTALDAAISARILLPADRYAFRHPRIRTAVYSAAAPADRRAVHAALGAATDSDRDPDGRAWHLAASVAGLDDAVADDLDRAADRARHRGGLTAQSAYLSRAAELTSDPDLRARRYLAAARPALLAGDAETAARRLAQATPGLASPALRAAGERMRAAIDWYGSGVAARAPAILLDALATFGPVDDATTRAMLWEALAAAILAGDRTDGVSPRRVARTALTAPPREPGRATLDNLLLDAFATRIAVGYGPAVPLLRAAVTAMRTIDLTDSDTASNLVGIWAALDLWDDEAFTAIVGRMEVVTRSLGAMHALKSTLDNAAISNVFTGRFDAAMACHREATEIGLAIGAPDRGLEHAVEVLAWQGREPESRAAAEVIEREWVDGLRYGILGTHVSHSMVVLELGLGRYREALARSGRLLAEDPPGQGSLVLSDVVEAGIRAGDRPAAESALARLADRASASGTAWALGVLARGRALLATDAAAEQLYRESADLLARTSVRTELARTHLLHGEWLRRRGRRSDARDRLRTAHDMFTTMGAGAFAERARAELRATGESVRPRGAAAPTGLTAQELQVATLAMAGATNAEIAVRLFVTSSTVEYHMNKIFRKLGITSRRQLANVLGAP